MPSKLKQVKFSGTGPSELKPLVKQRRAEIPYASESGYVIGLILYDLMCDRPHRITASLMALPPDIRDELVDEIIENVKQKRKTGRALEDGYFERRIKEEAEKLVAAKLAQDKAPEP